MSTNVLQAIPFSKYTTEGNNKILTMEVIVEEIFEAIKQLNPHKTVCPDGMQVIFY